MKHLDWEGTTWDCENWSIAIEQRELLESGQNQGFCTLHATYLFSVHRGRSDNQLKIPSSRQDWKEYRSVHDGH
jgi:hypothetical protein